jgi:glycosyltransferase involved in cell wall biosynthesis
MEDFYIRYPDFDLLFYKYIYSNLNFENNIDYLIHYDNIGINENKIYSMKYFIEKYNVDMNFIKSFYSYFENYSNNDIVKDLINNIDKYILSDIIFNQKFPDFNLKIYKLFNNINIIDDIKCKSYWFHNDFKNNKSNKVYSINSFLKNDHNFNLTLYKYTYNIENFDEYAFEYWYHNKTNLIYSNEIFINEINDFNFIDFIKDNPILKKSKKNNILIFYINNITKIRNIYSYKYFLIKYPNFNFDEFSIFNKNMSLYTYHNLINKEHIIVSIQDFYNKNKNFNLKLYKGILKNNDFVFENDNTYLYHYHDNHIEFYNLYPDFDLNLYKYFNNDKNNDIIDTYIDFDSKIKLNKNIIYSINTFYFFFKNFDKDIYRLCNHLEAYFDNELIIHFHNIGLKLDLIYNYDTFINKNKDFSIKIYKTFNENLKNLSDSEIVIHWLNNKDNKKIYSIQSFYKNYPNMKFENNEEERIINWKNTIIGHQYVDNISEVLTDLENINKNKLEKGISLIIRAKNEEDNIKNCIESVIDLVDEIIFVDNNSSDKTYEMVEEYKKTYDKIKLYKYNIHVSKAGIEHSNAIKDLNKNTLGTFYNWCLSKATKYNVFKWDADFICIRNNFIQLVNIYNLRNRDDKFAIWFTGKTLFENNNIYYINDNSFYNEYRIFSYKNDFKWYDGDICEFTEPYLEKCNSQKKYKYIYPLFYEVKRTSIDEFKERSSLIDSRDINDHKILNSLKKNNSLHLININNNIIFNNNKILLYTPSLSLGGGNQFIINIYNIYKSFGFNVKIIPLNNENIGLSKFNNIIHEDIITFEKFNLKQYEPEFIFLNSIFPFTLNDINFITNHKIKIIFITHSDVAYSNYYIENNHNIFYKIITVNNYTINKLSNLINIQKDRFYKITNYIDPLLICEKNIYKKNKKFGVISRFSEDKNIPMLIISLIEIFNKYPDYICYLVGTYNNNYDNYLQYLCKYFNINKNIIFTGFQDNVLEYYKLFDFIILPSVSEGCSYNIIEALSLGLPVIGSDVGGNHELIKNNINGILYEYDGIKEFEKKSIYINNYNEQLSIIGYFINNNNFNEQYINNCYYKDSEAIIPIFVSCKKCNKNNNLCTICNYKNKKYNIFNENIKKISNAITTLIEMNYDNIKLIKNNNIIFFNNNFNKKIYINELLEIINLQ